MNLQSKIAIVTGASSGIGTEFSKMLIESGSIIYGLARNTKKLETIKKNLGNSFIPVTLDITIMTKLGVLGVINIQNENPHILVNNAGIGIFGGVDKLKVQKIGTK